MLSAQFLFEIAPRAVQSDAQRDKNYSALSATMQHALTRTHNKGDDLRAGHTQNTTNKKPFLRARTLKIVSSLDCGGIIVCRPAVALSNQHRCESESHVNCLTSEWNRVTRPAAPGVTTIVSFHSLLIAAEHCCSDNTTKKGSIKRARDFFLSDFVMLMLSWHSHLSNYIALWALKRQRVSTDGTAPSSLSRM
jgi:hypothetical protein